MPDVITIAEDQVTAMTAAAMLAGDSDAGNDGFTVTSVSAVSGGTVTLVDGMITFTPDKDYHGAASFNYVMTDALGNVSDATKSITITSVNDRAVIVGPASFAVPVSGTQAITGVSISDVDAAFNPSAIYSGSLSGSWGGASFGDAQGMIITTDPIIGNGGVTDGVPWFEFSAAPAGTIYFSGTFEQMNAALATLIFTTPGGYAGPGGITLEIVDARYGGASSGSGGGMLTSKTMVMNIGSNGTPAIANLSGDAAAFVEDGDAVYIDVNRNALVTDDSANFNGGVLSVKIIAGKNGSEDIISFENWETSGIIVAEDDMGEANDVYVDGIVVGKAPIEYGAQGDDITITFNENADAAAVNTLIQALTYRNIDTIDPTTATRTVEISLTDGAGDDAKTATVQTSITVTAMPEVNHAPLVDLNGTASGTLSVTYAENRATPLRIATAATVVDNDPTPRFNGGFLEVAITDGSATETLSIVPNGFITVEAGSVRYFGGPMGFISGGTNGTPLKITFLSTEAIGESSRIAMDDLINSIGYSNSSEAPPASRTITFTLNDGGGTLHNGSDTAIATATVNITPSDDPMVAAADAASVNENGKVLIDVLANDIDPDGAAAAFATVNGEALGEGGTTTLLSGAVVKLADGKLEYDPSGKFNDLADFATGSANASRTDNFKYVLATGQEVLVTVTVKGVASLNDVVRGTAGDDLIGGTAGNDVIDGGAGNDIMTGGAGNDSYEVDDAGDKAVETPGQGTDRVLSSLAEYTLVEDVENLRGMLDSGQTLQGNGLSNNIVGGGGNDTLDGAGGNDRLQGNEGDDLYRVDSGLDKVIEKDGEGVDLIEAATSYSLAGQYVERLTLTGGGDTNATGNGLDNELTGNDGNNRLNGGVGADAMAGGLGNDVYVVDHEGDEVTEHGDAGTDRVESRISYALGDHVENLFLTGLGEINATGNALNNEIHGNDAANVIDGGAGNDVMEGGKGNDRYIVDHEGETVLELAGEGYDTVDASVTFSTAGRYIELLRLTGSDDIDAFGNGKSETIIGNSGRNVIDAGEADDKLAGGAGNDTLTGGAGSDRFIFDAALEPTNVDEITDFSAADDSIHLDRDIFAGVNSGALRASLFYAGTAAHDANDRIIYDGATGNIFYDADGDGAAAQVLFATVDPATILTAADFIGF